MPADRAERIRRLRAQHEAAQRPDDRGAPTAPPAAPARRGAPHDSTPARAVLGGVVVTAFLVLLSFMGTFHPGHTDEPTTAGGAEDVVLSSHG